MAKPTADSAAATVKTNKEKTCPTKSSRKTEKVIKLRLTASSINSTDINIIIMFFRFKIMPNMPSKNKINDTNKKSTKPNMVCFFNLHFVFLDIFKKVYLKK